MKIDVTGLTLQCSGMRKHQVQVRLGRCDLVVRFCSFDCTEPKDRPCSTSCSLERHSPHRLAKSEPPMYQPLPRQRARRQSPFLDGGKETRPVDGINKCRHANYEEQIPVFILPDDPRPYWNSSQSLRWISYRLGSLIRFSPPTLAFRMGLGSILSLYPYISTLHSGLGF